MPNASKYRDRITVEKEDPDATADDAGVVDLDNDDNWIQYISRRARIIPVSGGEGSSSRQVQAFINWTVELRYDSLTKAITPEMRILFGTKKLNITSVINVDQMNREIIMECVEKASGS